MQIKNIKLPSVNRVSELLCSFDAAGDLSIDIAYPHGYGLSMCIAKADLPALRDFLALPIPAFITPIPGKWYELQHLTGRYFCVGVNASGEMMFHSEDYPNRVIWHFNSIQILREYAEPIPEFITPIPGKWYELQHLTGRYFCVGVNASGKMMFHSEDYPSLVLWHYDSIQILREYAEKVETR